MHMFVCVCVCVRACMLVLSYQALLHDAVDISVW